MGHSGLFLRTLGAGEIADEQGQPPEVETSGLAAGLLRCQKGTKFPGGVPGIRPKVSERLVGSAGLGVSGGCLADDAVRVLAAAAWAAQAVVAALGQLHAACGRQVAEQAGQHQGKGAHEGPAGAAV